MKRSEADLKLGILREQIQRHDHLYYTLSAPEISDAEYDHLMLLLRTLEAEHPDLVTPDSPSQKVGGGLSTQFQPVTHDFPMLSLGNVFTQDELQAWLDGLPSQTPVVAEWKLDGVSLSLTYESGVLKRAVTRGTGLEGEDVTLNALGISGIPRKLPNYIDNDIVTVRGEVVVSKSDFAELNAALQASNQREFKNERNYVSGSLRQKNPAVTAARRLQFLAYSYHSVMDTRYETYRQWMQVAHDMGFACVASVPLSSDVTHYLEMREKLPWVVDGVVFKVDSLSVQTELGFNSREPRWAVAYKFPASTAVSSLLQVDWQVGRTGNLTPVARIDPVRLHGVVVSNVTLHNAEEIARLGLFLGARVNVERRGDVIPKIMGVVPTPDNTLGSRIEIPTVCPCCKTQVLQRVKAKSKKEVEMGAVLYCPNHQACTAQIKGRLLHLVSRNGLDIDGLGEQTIADLVDKGLIRNWGDIFRLTVEDFLKLEGFAEPSARQAVASIQACAEKGRTMAQLLEAVGITGAGKGTAKRLSENLGNIDRFLVAWPQTLEQLPDIGLDTATNIVQWRQLNHEAFQDLRLQLRIVDDNRDVSANLKGTLTDALLDKLAKRDKLTDEAKADLRQHWIWWGLHESCGVPDLDHGPLHGQTWVLTGALAHYTREDAAKQLEALGAKVTNSVSKNTTVVIAGPGAGSKETKARELGVPVESESYLRAVLE